VMMMVMVVMMVVMMMMVMAMVIVVMMVTVMVMVMVLRSLRSLPSRAKFGSAAPPCRNPAADSERNVGMRRVGGWRGRKVKGG
jgi:hypothetical protein